MPMCSVESLKAQHPRGRLVLSGLHARQADQEAGGEVRRVRAALGEEERQEREGAEGPEAEGAAGVRLALPLQHLARTGEEAPPESEVSE